MKRVFYILLCRIDWLTLVLLDRAIACAHCGQTLDPIDFIHQNVVVINLPWQDHLHCEARIERNALAKVQARNSSGF